MAFLPYHIASLLRSSIGSKLQEALGFKQLLGDMLSEAPHTHTHTFKSTVHGTPKTLHPFLWNVAVVIPT